MTPAQRGHGLGEQCRNAGRGRGAGGAKGAGVPGVQGPHKSARVEVLKVEVRGVSWHKGRCASGRTEATGDWYRGGGAAYYQEIFVDPHLPDTIYSVDNEPGLSAPTAAKRGRQTGWERPACTSTITS